MGGSVGGTGGVVITQNEKESNWQMGEDQQTSEDSGGERPLKTSESKPSHCCAMCYAPPVEL